MYDERDAVREVEVSVTVKTREPQGWEHPPDDHLVTF
jgi:hypothetical protein